MERIVILGGGFGGIRCALNLSRSLSAQEAEIIIIDKHSYHTFTPALYEVASAYRQSAGVNFLNLRRSVSISYPEIFEGTHVKHLQGEIGFIDTQSRTIFLKHGKEIPYTYAVFALGSEATDYNIPGVKQNAIFFKTTEDALAINRKLNQLFEAYLQGDRAQNLQIILAGAGFTGVELAAELASCLRKLGQKHKIGKKFFSIMIFEAAPQMLPMLKPSERKTLMTRLTKIGVGVTEHSPIEEVTANVVKLADGHTYRADLIIWSAGIKPHPLLERTELTLTAHKKIAVDPHLRVRGFQHFFAVGDSIEFIDVQTQQPVPALAYTAIEQAKIVAHNIGATMKKKHLKTYKPISNSWSVPVGAKYALTQINSSLWVAGFGAWLIRLWIDLHYFISILPFRKAINFFTKQVLIFTENDTTQNL